MDTAGYIIAIVRSQVMAEDVEGLAISVPVGETARDLGIAARAWRALRTALLPISFRVCKRAMIRER